MEQANAANTNANGFYQPFGAKPEFNNAYVVPTSSTSTGSNNSSMHSTQSMPDIMLDSSPKKSSNLPFQLNNYIHTQTPPPLIYPSSSANTSTAVQFALSTSMSTPTAAATSAPNPSNGIEKPLEFPSLFSLKPSSADETVRK